MHKMHIKIPKKISGVINEDSAIKNDTLVTPIGSKMATERATCHGPGLFTHKPNPWHDSMVYFIDVDIGRPVMIPRTLPRQISNVMNSSFFSLSMFYSTD